MGTIMPHITAVLEPGRSLLPLPTGTGCTCSQTRGEACGVHGSLPKSPNRPTPPTGLAPAIVLLGLAVDAALADEIRRIGDEDNRRGYERDETDTEDLVPAGPTMGCGACNGWGTIVDHGSGELKKCGVCNGNG
ncbi:hypothetical protein [Streptomyces mayteni]